MRKFLTMIATLLMALGLMAPAYAAETDGTDPSEYTESQQYVYLVQGANLYLGPDESYDVYSNAETAYNQKILISGVYTNGWAKYFDANGNQWLYVAPEDIIWNEADAYTKADYDTDSASGVSNPGYYSESQQYVYLVQGANLYLGPDTSYDVYSNAYEEYNLEVIVSDVYENGWARYKTSTDSALWLYVAPEDIIWEETDAYTKEEYLLTMDYEKEFFWFAFSAIVLAICGISINISNNYSLTFEIICTAFTTGFGVIDLHAAYKLYTLYEQNQALKQYSGVYLFFAIMLGIQILSYLIYCFTLALKLKKRKQTSPG